MPVALSFRAAARRDIEEIADRYTLEASEDVALRFTDALERAAERLSERPLIGSARYAEAAAEAGLRHKRIAGFPYLIFYLTDEHRLEIVRILHVRRDIPGILTISP